MARTAPGRNQAGPPAGGGPRAGDTWQLRDAKARFSELFSRALEHPQRITRHGKQAVVVLAEDEYEALRAAGRRGRKSLVQLFAEAPLEGVDLVRDEIDFQPRDIDP